MIYDFWRKIYDLAMNHIVASAKNNNAAQIDERQDRRCLLAIGEDLWFAISIGDFGFGNEPQRCIC